ncbi:hypothetical protein B0H10DRAFT_2188254 [Mycena sp. CBHHK59/15]|nr:hypothetical protein B0H10DRAFT_2188254 [Mycena sp. CBHHK59/15]
MSKYVTWDQQFSLNVVSTSIPGHAHVLLPGQPAVLSDLSTKISKSATVQLEPNNVQTLRVFSRLHFALPPSLVSTAISHPKTLAIQLALSLSLSVLPPATPGIRVPRQNPCTLSTLMPYYILTSQCNISNIPKDKREGRKIEREREKKKPNAAETSNRGRGTTSNRAHLARDEAVVVQNAAVLERDRWRNAAHSLVELANICEDD